MNHSPMRLVLSTAPANVSQTIAQRLVEEGVAACVNLVPGVQSIYRWKGAVCNETEVLMIMKTTVDRMEALTTLLKALHPYEVPEIATVTLHDDEGNFDYLDWISNCVHTD